MMTLDSVVLPQPLSPTSPKHSPRMIEKLRSSTARNVVRCAPGTRAAGALLERLADAAHVEVDRGRIRGPRLPLLDQRAGLVVDRAHRHQPFARLHVEMRHRAEQRLQVRVRGPLEQRLHGAALHDLALVEDDDLVGDVGHHAEIVGDDQHGHLELGLQVLDQGEDLRLDGDVERRRRLVGDQQRGSAHQRHRDHRPLAQAAGELERIALEGAFRVRESDQAEHLLRPRHAVPPADLVVEEQRLADLVADRVQGRERHHRFLEDHRYVAPANRADRRAVRLEPRDVDRRPVGSRGVEQDLAGRDAGGLGQDAQDGLRRHRLARAGFADERQRPAGRDAEGNPVERGHPGTANVELDRKVADLDQVGQSALPALRVFPYRAIAGRTRNFNTASLASDATGRA